MVILYSFYIAVKRGWPESGPPTNLTDYVAYLLIHCRILSNPKAAIAGEVSSNRTYQLCIVGIILLSVSIEHNRAQRRNADLKVQVVHKRLACRIQSRGDEAWGGHHQYRHMLPW